MQLKDHDAAWGSLPSGSDKSLLLTDPHAINLTNNQYSIHDKLSLCYYVYGKRSKYKFSCSFLLKNGLCTNISSSDFHVPMFFFTESGKARDRFSRKHIYLII